MSKQLRLEIAELTDVGRRRDSNEDNMTRLIPKDPKVLERKGAIFVVADGMGGHAAGEVASEIAVETIRETYYEAESDDIAEILTQATKQANQVIYDRATEQAGRAGMGTTCVTVVVRGPLAYIANVGDSRVYLIREGHIRQLTNDHSWVAEQVRAGMLTDEQARTHAHRNVITRALGTQPEVEADLFVEVLQDGDLLLLCSDGLSGPVSDEEMNRIISSSSPQEAVRGLIAQANEQGGPDNITAVLIHVLEAPPLAPEAQEQLAALVDGAYKEETGGMKLLKKPRKRLSPVALALRIFGAALILFISLAVWDVGFGPIAWTRNAHNQLSADLSRAQTLIAQAQQEAPAQAINTLAMAQHPLLNDLHNAWLSSDDRQQATNALQQLLAPPIRQALSAYNTLAQVKPLSTLQTNHFSVSCGAAPGGQIDQLVAIPQATSASTPPGGPGSALPLLFARSHSTNTPSAVYALTVNGAAVTCGAVIDPSVVDMTTDGSLLYLLHEDGSSFTVEQMAAPNAKPQRVLTLPPDSRGALPILLAVHGAQIDVLYRGTGDIVYACQTTPPTSCVPRTPAPLPVQAHSITLAPNGALYLLLVDGSIGVLTATGLHPANLSSLLPVLPVGDPNSFSPMTALPMVPATSTFSAPSPTASPSPSPTSTATATPSATPAANPAYTPSGVQLANATVLVSDQQNHLFVGDGADHRVIQLNAPVPATSDPTPNQQYADPSALDSLLSISAVASGPQSLSLYVLGGHTLLVITLA